MLWIISITFLVGSLAFAQDYQDLHERGRELYHESKDVEALRIYDSILEEYPGDIDALLFRGRILARMEAYEAAEQDLLRVIAEAPDYLDAYYALASLYYWQGDLDPARRMLTRWLERAPRDPNAHVLSARVAVAGKKYAAARTFLEQASRYGAAKEVLDPLLQIMNSPVDKYRWKGGVQYEYLAVDQERPDWRQLGTYLGHDFGSIIVTAEFSRYHRNDLTDHSVKADTYIQLWKKAYMNAGIKAGLNGTFLPRADLNTELFQALGTRQEVAAGYRLMYYDSLAVHLPSLAWAAYPGNWYLRDKVSMIVREAVSWQNQLTVRYYFKNADHYVQLMNVLGTDLNVLNNARMQSIAFALGGSYCLTDQMLLTADLSWTRDEYALQRFGGSAGLIYRW
ncbi:MAG: YaiO family outer membrane beta-barrel protein [Candidatus Marinimicrobia bacterium]|nr:YaiO family outer membrane beta-barrel protein [Candidatus Neomarinimicrobiota bacterium]